MNQSSCQNCPAGHKCGTEQIEPIPCSKGYYQDKSTQDFCSVCGKGTLEKTHFLNALK